MQKKRSKKKKMNIIYKHKVQTKPDSQKISEFTWYC